ncbi:MAG: SCO family protein [Pseudomonadales bacterium]|nr:SCO family protein [Halioglobus sp.]MCP5128627.1 SCO family protein [Pseudomonadales bacterium]
MRKFTWPALAGLCFLLSVAFARAEPGLATFSREEALAYSQAAIGKTLAGVTLVDADGRQVSLEDFRGKPLVISLIFTSCHHICPSTTQHLQQVVSKARDALDEDSFQVISVGFDTANDSPERMRQFGENNGVTDPRWQFLAGDAAAVESLVNQLGFIYTPSSRGFDHLIQSSIIDADGKVYRQVYGITFPTPQLIEPLKELVFGEPREQSALSHLGNRIRLFCTVYDPATDNYYIDISVFIGTIVGVITSLVFGRILIKEWRKSIRADR